MKALNASRSNFIHSSRNNATKSHRSIIAFFCNILALLNGMRMYSPQKKLNGMGIGLRDDVSFAC